MKAEALILNPTPTPQQQANQDATLIYAAIPIAVVFAVVLTVIFFIKKKR